MAPLLGTLLAIVLGCLGLLHFIWAAGISFPFPNEQALARSVVGRRGITRLPSRAAVVLLGVLLMCGACAAMIMGHYAASVTVLKFLLVPVGLFLSALFLLRGLVGVLPAFERAAPEQPYLSLNRRLYSPLCALIGAGFLALTFSLPNWSWHFSRLFG
ncbi:MAG: hypothetical protein CVT79_08270 [Alphaproteobacteria bacterium HGW-Alphaproteobacteria-18]|nr:MAG: hypothetical protein CVT79_08270 [Alphaproteobacteria bacterium HGW-Alphaproteobacteria-18]